MLGSLSGDREQGVPDPRYRGSKILHRGAGSIRRSGRGPVQAYTGTVQERARVTRAAAKSGVRSARASTHRQDRPAALSLRHRQGVRPVVPEMPPAPTAQGARHGEARALGMPDLRSGTALALPGRIARRQGATQRPDESQGHSPLSADIWHPTTVQMDTARRRNGGATAGRRLKRSGRGDGDHGPHRMRATTHGGTRGGSGPQQHTGKESEEGSEGDPLNPGKGRGK